MHSDLFAACKVARTSIDVPGVPLNAIKRAAEEPAAAPRARLSAVVLAIALPLAAAAAGAAVWQGAQITMMRNGGIVIKSGAMHSVFNPTPSDLQSAAHDANFAVTLPSGLPEGTKPIRLQTSPGLIALAYDLPGAWRASHHLLHVLLLNVKMTRLAKSDGGVAPVKLELRQINARVYQTGDEAVVVGWDSLTPEELARIVTAMHLR
jgi:hypothetical protein